LALEKAPVVRSDKPGTFFDLRAKDLGSVDIGSPVYYRWLRVGQVAGYELDEVGEHVSVQVFIEAPLSILASIPVFPVRSPGSRRLSVLPMQ
jgi:paraquat-inducible protein B